ncbi:MAG TPA: riboflavin biosynthesis protein RibF [Candidatus Kapabacteria bacterium]|nr:riboflavin biosynthesis protein RibF [Candidatus Kapabacteria bacterium]
MKLYQSLDEIPRGERHVITIGTFDGVHLGHRLIITALVRSARELNARSLVITFHPHPQEVLRRTGEPVPILTTIEERMVEMERAGVDAVAVLPFTRELANTPWQEFCELLMEKSGLVHFVVGHDHAFGKNREGNAAAMAGMGARRGFGVTEIGPLVLGEEAVSSTKIRRALMSGDIEKATSYLGRHYSFQGTVVRGDGRGRSLGIPTANIRPLEAAKLIPMNGVYCVQLLIDGEKFRGMANIGVRPTFTEGITTTIEANLFDFDRDIYEQVVTIEFLKFVRSEQKFASAAAFMEQLERDRAVCKE